jgi:nucleotide-binding universal stress UspA family protein
MKKKVLVPVDGSEHARKAVEFAADWAVQNDATVCLLHVVSPSKVPEGIKEFAKSEHMKEDPATVYLKVVGDQILGAAETHAKSKGVKDIQTETLEGDPAESIIDYARNGGYDMIVIGSRGLGSIKGLMLGSVSSKVCHAADRTCVTVQ